MPDYITPAERAAIDAALAAGRVNRIPQGKSATAVDYVWDGAHLVQADGGSRCWRKQKQIQYGRPKRPETTDRRARVLAMSLQGLRSEAIADELGVSRRVVNYYRAELRKTGDLPPEPRTSKQIDEANARRAQVLPLWKSGTPWQQIADTLGTTFTCIKRDILILRRAGHRREAA